MSYMRALWRICKLGLLTAFIVPAQILIAGPIFKDRQKLSRLMSTLVLMTMGIRVSGKGVPIERDRATIFVANHTSTMDILVMKSLTGGAFSGSDHVKKWPAIGWLVGWLGDNMGAVYIRRGKGKADIPNVHEDVANALNRFHGINVFAEGKIPEEEDVVPFKSGMISIMFNNLSNVKLEKDVVLQPVSLRLCEISGKNPKDNPGLKSGFMWRPEQKSVLSHLWQVLKNRETIIEATIHPAMEAKNFMAENGEGYKEMAEAARKIIRADIYPEKVAAEQAVKLSI